MPSSLVKNNTFKVGPSQKPKKLLDAREKSLRELANSASSGVAPKALAKTHAKPHSTVTSTHLSADKSDVSPRRRVPENTRSTWKTPEPGKLSIKGHVSPPANPIRSKPSTVSNAFTRSTSLPQHKSTSSGESPHVMKQSIPARKKSIVANSKSPRPKTATIPQSRFKFDSLPDCDPLWTLRHAGKVRPKRVTDLSDAPRKTSKRLMPQPEASTASLLKSQPVPKPNVPCGPDPLLVKSYVRPKPRYPDKITNDILRRRSSISLSDAEVPSPSIHNSLGVKRRNYRSLSQSDGFSTSEEEYQLRRPRRVVMSRNNHGYKPKPRYGGVGAYKRRGRMLEETRRGFSRQQANFGHTMKPMGYNHAQSKKPGISGSKLSRPGTYRCRPLVEHSKCSALFGCNAAKCCDCCAYFLGRLKVS